MAAYHHLKLVMLILACAYAVWRCATDEITARRETSPTEIRMAEFEQDYDGQQWLRLKGRLDLAKSFTPPGERLGARGNRPVQLWYAMRGESDAPGDPVHAFVLMRPDEAVATAKSTTPTVTGQQVFFDPDKVFPGVRRGEPFVMIQSGNTPGKPGVGLGLGLFFAAILAIAVWAEVRAVRQYLSSRRECRQRTAPINK